MGESTGRIVFINSHDYVSDVTGTPAIGCMASLRSDPSNQQCPARLNHCRGPTHKLLSPWLLERYSGG